MGQGPYGAAPYGAAPPAYGYGYGYGATHTPTVMVTLIRITAASGCLSARASGFMAGIADSGGADSGASSSYLLVWLLG